MKILSAITTLLLLLVTASFVHAANYPFALHAVNGDARSVYELGVSQVRISPIIWDNIEPQKGTYDFASLDQTVKRLQKGQVNLIVGTLRDISMWGGNLLAQTGYDPQNPLTAKSGFPSDIAGWKTFLNTIVERYDGDGVNDMPGLTTPIKYWQIEGEWQWQWLDTTQNYLDFLNISYLEVKNADPTAKVVGGSLTGSIAFAVGEGFDGRGYLVTDDGAGGTIQVTQSELVNNPGYQQSLTKVNTFLANAQNSYDILDIHLYSADAYNIPPAMAWLNSSLTANGYTKPVWSLENAGPLYNYNETFHAREVVARYLFSITSGIQKAFWSSLHVTPGWSNKYVLLSLIDDLGRKKPAFYTYQLLTQKMDGYDLLEVMNIGAGVNCYKITRNNAVTYIMWSDQGATGTILLPRTIIKATNAINLKKKTVRYRGGTLNIKLWNDPIILEIK